MYARRLLPIASILALSALLFALPSTAETLSPRQFIESLGEETIGAITNADVSEEDRLTEFARLFRKGFDVDTISRFVLGRYWRRATDEQKVEYQSLFADFIVTTYANRFRQYSGEKLLVDGERPASKRDTIVSSEIKPPDGPAVRVDWRVRKTGDDHKIIDVIVEGVSMAITQRDEFASVIRRGGGGVETLIAELRNKSSADE
tara:strand:+ start:3959 stop:4570 length:612 start_codon:yes stop_codon:yes gene_type:complete